MPSTEAPLAKSNLAASDDANQEFQIDKVKRYQEAKAPLGTVIPGLHRGSKLIYSYSYILDILREHDRTLNDGTNGLVEATLVDFDSPALIFPSAKGDPVRPNRYLQHNIKSATVLEFVQKNRRFLNDDKRKIVFENGNDSKPLFIEKYLTELSLVDGEMVEFDDQFDSKEMVFGITVDRTNKGITVFHRGTVLGGRDWATNFDALFVQHSTPKILETVIKDEKIQFHRGFYRYLFDVSTDGGTSKFDRIVTILKEEYKKHPKYDLYVSGHSLGAALSVMLSFALASDESCKDFPRPIRAVTFASPKVGNHVYARAYQALEKAGHLRHIQLSNKGDIVPTLPPGFWYSQSGVNLHVREGKRLQLGYCTSKLTASQLSLNPVLHHYIETYYDNLFNGKNDDILAMTMDDLYNEAVKNIQRDEF